MSPSPWALASSVHEVGNDFGETQTGFLSRGNQRRLHRVLDLHAKPCAGDEDAGREFDDQPSDVNILRGLRSKIDVHASFERGKALLSKLHESVIAGLHFCDEHLLGSSPRGVQAISD